MVRYGSLLAALLGAGVLLLGSSASACDENKGEQGRRGSVLERLDRLMDASKSHGKRQVFERWTSPERALKIPRNARYDASAGVFI